MCTTCLQGPEEAKEEEEEEEEMLRSESAPDDCRSLLTPPMGGGEHSHSTSIEPGFLKDMPKLAYACWR